jgi:hypothetical protein
MLFLNPTPSIFILGAFFAIALFKMVGCLRQILKHQILHRKISAGANAPAI